MEFKFLKTTRTPLLNKIIGDLKEGFRAGASAGKQESPSKTHRTEKQPSVCWEEVVVRYVIIVKVYSSTSTVSFFILFFF